MSIIGMIATIKLPVHWVPNGKQRRIPPTARTEMFGLWLKPSQKTLLLTYFSIPHGLARCARECDFRPRGKLHGLFARLDRVPDCLRDSCLNLFDFLSSVILPPKVFSFYASPTEQCA